MVIVFPSVKTPSVGSLPWGGAPEGSAQSRGLPSGCHCARSPPRCPESCPEHRGHVHQGSRRGMGAEIQPELPLLQASCPPGGCFVLLCFLSILHMEAQVARGAARRAQPLPNLLGPVGMSPCCGPLPCWSLPLGHGQAVPQCLHTTGAQSTWLLSTIDPQDLVVPFPGVPWAVGLPQAHGAMPSSQGCRLYIVLLATTFCIIKSVSDTNPLIYRMSPAPGKGPFFRNAAGTAWQDALPRQAHAARAWTPGGQQGPEAEAPVPLWAGLGTRSPAPPGGPLSRDPRAGDWGSLQPYSRPPAPCENGSGVLQLSPSAPPPPPHRRP